MKYLGVLILLLKCYFCFSQTNWNEYIENPSFELYDTCPTGFSSPTSYQINTCLGWTIPTLATADYYNSCNTATVGVPINSLGEQNAYDGVAYCGIFATRYTFRTVPELYYKEYIQTKLKKKLAVNHLYEFSFYINRADKCGYAAKNIGALFSESNLNRNDYLCLIATPQIKSNDFVSDTMNWTKVTGMFIANGNEQYLTIGNFKDTFQFNEDTLCMKPGTDWQDGWATSYYYIDGLTFEDKGDALLPNIFTPNNDAINDYISFDKFLGLNKFKVSIYNRWGNIVFYSDDPNIKWYGKDDKNNSLYSGTYYYIINFSSDSTKEHSIKGFIQLITNQ